MPHTVLLRLAAFVALLVCAPPALAQVDGGSTPSRAAEICAGVQTCTIIDPVEAIPADNPALAEERALLRACDTGDAAACRALAHEDANSNSRRRAANSAASR